MGALKKIFKDTMRRDDVVVEIEKWEKLSVCHGCQTTVISIALLNGNQYYHLAKGIDHT